MLSVNMNRDVEQYRESVLFGLSAGQAASVFLAAASGLIVVALLYYVFGIAVEVGIYASLPVCIPILLPALGKKYGLSVTERIRQSSKRKKVLLYKTDPVPQMRQTERPIGKKESFLEMAAAQWKGRKGGSLKSYGKKERIFADKK